jgi:hypothetical protein
MKLPAQLLLVSATGFLAKNILNELIQPSSRKKIQKIDWKRMAVSNIIAIRNNILPVNTSQQILTYLKPKHVTPSVVSNVLKALEKNEAFFGQLEKIKQINVSLSRQHTTNRIKIPSEVELSTFQKYNNPIFYRNFFNQFLQDNIILYYAPYVHNENYLVRFWHLSQGIEDISAEQLKTFEGTEYFDAWEDFYDF